MEKDGSQGPHFIFKYQIYNIGIVFILKKREVKFMKIKPFT